MKTKGLESIFLILVIITITVFLNLFLIDNPKIQSVNEPELTGNMQKFEVSHEKKFQHYDKVKNTERDDDKLLAYLEKIQESRDRTFFR